MIVPFLALPIKWAPSRSRGLRGCYLGDAEATGCVLEGIDVRKWFLRND